MLSLSSTSRPCPHAGPGLWLTCAGGTGCFFSLSNLHSYHHCWLSLQRALRNMQAAISCPTSQRQTFTHRAYAFSPKLKVAAARMRACYARELACVHCRNRHDRGVRAVGRQLHPFAPPPLKPRRLLTRPLAAAGLTSHAEQQL